MMALPDSISVSETGGAIQSFPIAVPPGTAGVVPSLSLTYNSQGANGIVGMGFMLNGLASIGRCPKTKVTDGVIDGVSFDANDRFCLDGQRLIAVSGTYGADGTEYRTEIESFSRVISYGSAGSGPAWFKVWTKSGQIMEFGNSVDSRILATGRAEARIWSVNKVADTAGNYMTVRYVNDTANGQAYPSRIDYTGNDGAGLAPYNSVRFVYDTDRPDVMTAYQAGSFTRTTVLLTNIQTYADETLVSDYRLAYGQGATTGRMRLRSVTLCEGGGACLPATTIGWTNGGDGTLGFSSHVDPIDPEDIDGGTSLYFGDWNGDGLTDVMWWSQEAGDPHAAGSNRWFINNNNTPDILSTVTNGLGAETSITYSLMTDGSVYAKDTGANAASFPVVDVIGPMQVASRIEQADGVGDKRVFTYRYAGAKMDLTGYGFLGFREVTERDEQTGIEKTSVYEQTYPFTMMKKSETTIAG